jgi:dATP pyrophosphohydrolase
VRLPHEVFVAVRRGNEYLILLRSARQGGYWHCVAGALEPGETAHEAAARELREETGLEAELLDLGTRYVYPLAEESPEVRARFMAGTSEVIVDCFLAEAPEGWEPLLDWEHDEHRWCTVPDAVELLYWAEPRKLLQELG